MSAIPDNVINKQLYAEIKQKANSKYKRDGLFKSAFIVKEYVSAGGRYSGEKQNQDVGINRWLKKEQWISVIPYLTKGEIVECGSEKGKMIACRPLIRASPSTPPTLPELIAKFGRDRILSLARAKEASPRKRVNWKAGTIK